MNGKIFKSVAAAAACATIFTSCDFISYYERIDTAIEMSEAVKELYTEGTIDIGDCIDSKNVSNYCNESDMLYQHLNSDKEFGKYTLAMIDIDKVLVCTDIVFHSVEGFIVNLGTEPLAETEYTVPESLGYDNNTITLLKIDQYENVLTYRATV